MSDVRLARRSVQQALVLLNGVLRRAKRLGPEFLRTTLRPLVLRMLAQ